MACHHSLRLHFACTKMFGYVHFTRFNDLSTTLQDRLMARRRPNHGCDPTSTILNTISRALTTAEDTHSYPAHAAVRIPFVLVSHVQMPLVSHMKPKYFASVGCMSPEKTSQPSIPIAVPLLFFLRSTPRPFVRKSP